MIILLIGAPGAGKGTLAQALEAEGEYKHISSGNILRAEIKSGSEFGREIANIIDAGNLVSDELALKIVSNAIEKEKVVEKILLDGYPRNLKQARDLEEELRKHGKKVDLVINVFASKEVIEQRLVNRLTCPVCHAVYNIITAPPKNDNKCDKCNATLIHRPDDSLEVVRKRHDIYQKETFPLTTYYKEKGLLKDIKSGEVEKSVAEVNLYLASRRGIRP